MTEQQIKDNAPDGATHYHADEFEVWYFRVNGSGLYQWCDDEFTWADYYCEDYYADLKPL